MNRHFQDTRYYLKRASEATRAGFGEELESLRGRLASIRGRAEENVETGRLDRARRTVRDTQRRASKRIDGLRTRRPTR